MLQLVLLIGILFLLAYILFIWVMKIRYDNGLYPGREVFIYIERINGVEKDVVIKHENGIIYTRHGCFTFRDYLNDIITES